MKIGINIRVMGPQSSRNTIASILKQAEAAGVESAWIVDHIAIPPDEAEGSGGRYLDPLTSLAWMAGQTQSILIGTSVLILPYRPKLPTAKAIATIQELSGERLLLGVGIGWMDPEFQALGVDRHRRGRLSDETLAFLHECFDNDIVTANDQRFLFKPRPARPPIYIGGSAPHAIDRALKYGDGWLPMGHLDKIAPQIRQYHERSEASQGKPGEVVTFATLPEGDVDRAREMISRYSAAGVTRIIIGRTYESAKDWAPTFELLSALNS
ncbi:MAG: TIGR03619 family F420-dependent LLM class oxidoreductase [Gammaproteobacteria bacterium]|nr:TIGR03619 family F420-dependent LLM class oxidoreductase [Gammaproteobacteria bacterium]